MKFRAVDLDREMLVQHGWILVHPVAESGALFEQTAFGLLVFERGRFHLVIKRDRRQSGIGGGHDLGV